MRTKWLLIALPLLVFGVLTQAAFWVPTYDSQAERNPARLTTFLRANNAGPKVLNPILTLRCLTFKNSSKRSFDRNYEHNSNWVGKISNFLFSKVVFWDWVV